MKGEAGFSFWPCESLRAYHPEIWALFLLGKSGKCHAGE